MRNQHQLILVLLVGVALGPLACEREPEAPPEPVKSEEEIRQEQEAARREQQSSALAERAGDLTAATADLAAQIEGQEFGLPEALESARSEVVAKREEADRLLGELQQSSGAAWETARSSLEAALSSLEQANAQASEALAEWSGREQAAMEARAESESPIDPGSGLIRGLDGGDYEQYLVSVVVDVQERLRRLGLYAGPADGRFDRPTLEAVGRFQEQHGLQVSGVPSPMTRHQLLE